MEKLISETIDHSPKPFFIPLFHDNFGLILKFATRYYDFQTVYKFIIKNVKKQLTLTSFICPFINVTHLENVKEYCP